MNPYARILQPADAFLPGLQSGQYSMNWPAQRLVDTERRRFVAALVPGDGLQQTFSQLPVNPVEAMAKMNAMSGMSDLVPVLQTMQIVNTVGALASVANLGVSCVGFAIVIQRLSRIEGKLDDMLGKLDVLQQTVNQIHDHQNALSLARIRAAGDSLDRGAAATTVAKREELAGHARNLFQESRSLYLELWRTARPWDQSTIPILTAIEMQNRFVACAIGEIQAEFLGGDIGAFRHAVASVVNDYKANMVFDAPSTLRARSNEACQAGPEAVARFGSKLAELSSEIRIATEVTQWTAQRLEGFSLEADLPEELGLEPHEVVQAVRGVKGDRLYALCPPSAA